MYETRRMHVARAILNYLRKNPHAQDTLAGISQWWLPEQRIKTSKTKLIEALTELVAKELIVPAKGKDSQIHYRINDRRLKEIEEFAREE